MTRAVSIWSSKLQESTLSLSCSKGFSLLHARCFIVNLIETLW
uniref:Uncharacterized protein n=1 Tax=Rhizophora mucronata TaxID=61149 RepID=A0A2P2QX05_RHIMU